jgi:hypothetical protein
VLIEELVVRKVAFQLLERRCDPILDLAPQRKCSANHELMKEADRIGRVGPDELPRLEQSLVLLVVP